MWRSQTFENTYQGGCLLVVPSELLPLWTGKGPEYDQLCEFSPGPIDYLQIGSGVGIFVAGPEGDIVHEAWFRRESPKHPLVLAAWNERGPADRDAWLTGQLEREDLEWAPHSDAFVVNSGWLALVHGENPGTSARIAPADRGECVQVGIAVGTYSVESLEIEERPDGTLCVVLARFVLLPAR
jgi:hypothetical protein